MQPATLGLRVAQTQEELASLTHRLAKAVLGERQQCGVKQAHQTNTNRVSGPALPCRLQRPLHGLARRLRLPGAGKPACLLMSPKLRQQLSIITCDHAGVAAGAH